MLDLLIAIFSLPIAIAGTVAIFSIYWAIEDWWNNK